MSQAFKRVLDTTAAFGLLAVASPFFVVAAIQVFRSSPGPLIFRQRRIGYNGRPFILYKFRTMYVGSDHEWRPPAPGEFLQFIFQPDDDPRITPVGRWLRERSWDELPQLLNVIKGDMSLIGPRPEIPEMVALYDESMHRRHQVRPGLTGLAQVSGRGTLTTGETLEYDLRYVDNWSWRLDCWIVKKTIDQLLGPSHTAR